MSKPLSITSTRHATALTLYAVLFTLGLFQVVGVASHDALTRQVGDPAAALWAMCYAVGPGLALAAAALAPAIRIPTLPLWGEAAGAALTGVTNIIYGVSLTRAFGFDGGPTTQTLAYGISLGMVARILQIGFDQWKTARARANPRLADPPPLAEADTHRG